MVQAFTLGRICFLVLLIMLGCWVFIFKSKLTKTTAQTSLSNNLAPSLKEDLGKSSQPQQKPDAPSVEPMEQLPEISMPQPKQQQLREAPSEVQQPQNAPQNQEGSEGSSGGPGTPFSEVPTVPWTLPVPAPAPTSQPLSIVFQQGPVTRPGPVIVTDFQPPVHPFSTSRLMATDKPDKILERELRIGSKKGQILTCQYGVSPTEITNRVVFWADAYPAWLSSYETMARINPNHPYLSVLPPRSDCPYSLDEAQQAMNRQTQALRGY